MDERNQDVAGPLLAWYDENARDLPWRVGPLQARAGIRADPYRVWLSEVMLQQTTVPVAERYFEDFLQRWPDVQSLAAANEADVMAAWAGLGYYARARNLLKCARVVVSELGGTFPAAHGDLLRLPGIGPYTAAAIAAIAFDRPEVVVDGNVERVVARLFAVTDPLPGAKPRLRACAAAVTPKRRPGDFAQAMMDLGATVCRPGVPACGVCPLAPQCLARRQGIAATLPARVRRAAKPVRHGLAYVARRADGAWLLERRPPDGLLGGMLAWPTTDWAEAPPAEDPPLPADWCALEEEVRHTFTHFHLRLSVRVARVDLGTAPVRGRFQPDLRPDHLPSVMRKVHALARDSGALGPEAPAVLES